ncbi:CPBP family intramembrane glutamic endopeptidase [Salipaludibacillus daqingensis]|uniref:CPBP family intramembrane glutamic endopeptidase n=1 Tax=Salipaludibacillus daqingensis TaxID=3041001 RepID=UPI00247302D6|nr:CPBP family intramembrane metalloprotease [Salipaludibacillus daqingensis]
MNKQAELIKKLTDKELILNLYVTQIGMLVIAILISLFLGNVFLPFQHLFFQLDHLMIGFVFGIGVVLIELFLYRIVPRKWFDDGGINERVFSALHPIHIVFISLIVAISEEILFRGVLQSQFGIWIASFIFALVHFRYLSNIFLFSVTVALSFSLGGLFLWTENLLTVIVAHFIIDVILGLLIRYKSKGKEKTG